MSNIISSTTRKADLLLSGLVANGGALNAEQSDSFFRAATTKSVVVKNARVVPMNAPTMEIATFGFNGPVLRPSIEATALADADRATATTGKIELIAKSYKAEHQVSYDSVEGNIEGGNLLNTVVEALGEAVSRDLEKLGIQGDTGSLDSFLATQNGVLKLADQNIVDAANAAISKEILLKALQTLPEQYLDEENLRFFLSKYQHLAFRGQVADRNSALGDLAMSSDVPVPAYGVGCLGAGMMPKASGLLTPPKNLLYGIHKDVTLHVDEDVRKGVFVFVLRTKVAFALQDKNAAVRIDNIGN